MSHKQAPKSSTPDISGTRVNSLLVIGRVNETRDIWLCKCDCGNERHKTGWYLRSGRIKSCGCQTKKILSFARTTHGRAAPASQNHNTFYVWRSMRSRCTNPRHKSYPAYGGRGITVCERWSVFNNFLADMGDVPFGLTIGRIDPNGNYEPENCRWETPKEQANNRRTNHLITWNGKTQTLQQWAEEVNISRDSIGHRLKSGWSIDDALTRPVRSMKNNRNELAVLA